MLLYWHLLLWPLFKKLYLIAGSAFYCIISNLSFRFSKCPHTTPALSSFNSCIYNELPPYIFKLETSLNWKFSIFISWKYFMFTLINRSHCWYWVHCRYQAYVFSHQSKSRLWSFFEKYILFIFNCLKIDHLNYM